MERAGEGNPMETDERLEDLLRTTFAQTRGEAEGDWAAIGAGAFARADRLRRRRAGLTVGAVAAMAAVVAATVGVGAGLLGSEDSLAPAHTAVSAMQWSRLVPGAGTFAYRFPDDVVPEPLPAGAQSPADVTVAQGGSGSAPKTTSVVAKQVMDDEPDLVGRVGFCRWTELAHRRQPVAGQSHEFDLTSEPGALGAHLGLAGFTTGTGAAAMADLRRGALPCLVPAELKAVPWAAAGDEHLLLSSTENLTEGGSPQTVVLAVTRVGDVLAAGAARGPDAAEARRVATGLSSEAAGNLVRSGFPPALGLPLGGSDSAPNAASALGARPVEALRTPEAYDIGDVFPSSAQLPDGMAYHGEAVTGTGTPAASGAQVCDSNAVSDVQGTAADTSPSPVAGAQRDAWVGQGVGADAGLTVSVTGWPTGTGSARFHDLQANTGGCVWLPSQTRVDWPGVDPDETWLSTSSEPGVSQFLAARRVGDLIVSVVVNGMPPAQGQAEAIRLNGIVAAKLAASDLPAAKGR